MPLQSGVMMLLVALGSVAGFFSGLLGIGGGILMVPLLLYAPPLCGYPALGMKAVAGITMVQSLAASLAGTLGHGQRRVHGQLVKVMGLAVAGGALAGSVLSRWLSGVALESLFAVLALVAGALLFLPVPNHSEDPASLPGFSRIRAAALGSAIGFLGGVVGQGGGFLIVPGLIYLLRIPVRIALGSSLAIGLISGIAGLAGKALTAQLILWPSLAVVAGALIGSLAGSRLSQRLSQGTLRRVLAVVIIAASVKIGAGLLPLSQATTAEHRAPSPDLMAK
ncbi:MAG TPA: sulfite exporter TauE/SafE family protein [Symbiobacteriaceae bacterium]|nr:sulfite exporter TauE/SafE family protein [Symbiobacteriaceae bacterium]